VLVIDDRTTMHRAHGDYDRSQSRVLWRIIVEGDRPRLVWLQAGPGPLHGGAGPDRRAALASCGAELFPWRDAGRRPSHPGRLDQPEGQHADGRMLVGVRVSVAGRAVGARRPW